MIQTIFQTISDNTVGVKLGGTLGLIKGLMMISMVSWTAVFDTAILSGVGTLIGLLISALYKKIFNSKKTP